MIVKITLDNEVFSGTNVDEVRNYAIRRTYDKYVLLQIPACKAISIISHDMKLSESQIRRIVTDRNKIL